jgi:hypothetical protein
LIVTLSSVNHLRGVISRHCAVIGEMRSPPVEPLNMIQEIGKS